MDIITYALAHKAKVALTSPKDGVPGKVLISDGQGGTTWGEHINILVVKASENSAFNSTADTITVTSIKDNKGKTWDKSSTHIGDTVYVEEQKLPDRWISKIEGSTIYLAKLETIQVPVVGVTVNDTSVVDTSTGIANIVVDDTLSAASENAIANKAVYVETQAIRTYATQAIADEFTRAANNENRIEGILNSEITRAKTAEEANTASINSEAANRKVADTTLQQNIDAEKTRATTVENAINQNLAQSVTNLSQIDAALQVNIANEKIRAEGVEATLQTNIDNEASLRSAADGVLQQNITAAISIAADDATTKATTAETNAKSYTDARIGDIGDNTNVKAYVDGKIGFLADNLDPDAIDSIKEVVDLVQGDGVIGQININKTDIAKITYAHEPELSEDKKMFFANGCPVKIINKGADLYAQYMIDNAAVANNSTGPINYKEMKITGVSHIYAGGNGKDKNVYYPATMLIIDVDTAVYTTKTSGDYAFTRVCGGCLGSGTVGSATVIVENGSFKGLYAGSSKELSTGANVSYDDACFTGEAKVVVNGGLINVLAANMDTTSTGHATYEINAGTVKWLYSAGANGMTGVVDVIINGGTVNNALSVVRGTSEEANWTVNGGSVATLYMSSDNDSSDWGNIKKVTLKALGGTITTLDKGGAANPVRSGSYKEGVITNLTSELATACNLTKIVDTDTTYEGSDSIEITGDNNSISVKDDYVKGIKVDNATNADSATTATTAANLTLVEGEGESQTTYTYTAKSISDALAGKQAAGDYVTRTGDAQLITSTKTFTQNILIQGPENADSYGAIRVDKSKDMILSAGNAIYLRKTNEATIQDDGLIVNFDTNSIIPETAKGLSIGASEKQFNEIYAETIYQNGERVQNEITESNKLLYNLIDGTPDLSSYITKEVSDLTNYKVEDRKITLGSNSIDIPEIKNAEGTAITEIQTETVSDILGVVSVVEENNTNIVTSGGVYNAIKDLGKCLPEFPEDKTKSYSLKLIPENGKLKLTWVADTTINDI